MNLTMPFAAHVYYLEIGDLIAVRIDIVSLRTGIHAEEFKFIRDKPHFLIEFSFCTVFNTFVYLDGSAGIAPLMIV